jgi:hypothetical protein
MEEDRIRAMKLPVFVHRKEKKLKLSQFKLKLKLSNGLRKLWKP